MTDQEVRISTLREARRIISEYTGPANANQTLTQLIAVLDRQDVAHAIERLEKGHEFRRAYHATAPCRPIKCYHR